jgi:hypothetical protein
MTDDEPALEKRFVLFFDFLGTSNAAKTWRRERVHQFKSLWTGVVLKDSIRILHAVAERALRIGLLIRGGLALGQFYHRDGVVFGEALVEACALKSKIANTPRILVSNHIVTLAMGDPSGAITTLLKDIDAKWHVNYYTEMVRERIHPGPSATCNSIPACFCK